MSDDWACLHVKNFEGNITKNESNITKHWKFCPHCGIPRCEPRNGLPEKLRDAYYKNPGEDWDKIALCALEHFVALVDKHSYPQPTNEPILFSNELKRAMEDSLK